MRIEPQMQVMGIKDTALVPDLITTPTPKPHEILIKVAYAGLNRADLFQVEGTYPPPEGIANIAGLEVSGIVAAIGDQVVGWEIGDTLCALLAGGGYAQYVCTDAALCLPIPSPLSLKEAAALPECAATVWLALFIEAQVKAGESVLVHGGASGIGTTAIQMLRAAGCKVWITAGSDEKTQACTALGAQSINYKTQDFVEIIKQSGGVNVILDIVGGDYISKNIKCLKPGGRLVSLAFLKGASMEVAAGGLLLKQLRWSGVTLRSQSRERKAEIMTALNEQVWPWVASGQLKPLIDSVFSLDDAIKAHEHMHNYLHIGKILLEVNANNI